MRPEKVSIVNEIKAALEESEYLFLADYNGMQVKDFAELRQALAESETVLHIYKNSFLGVALGSEKREALAEFLQGPTGLLTGSGDPTAVAKILVKFNKDHSKPSVKGGLLGTKFSAAVMLKRWRRFRRAKYCWVSWLELYRHRCHRWLA